MSYLMLLTTELIVSSRFICLRTMNVYSHSTTLDLRSVCTCLAHVLFDFSFRYSDSVCSLHSSYLMLGLHTSTRQIQLRRTFTSTVNIINVPVVSSSLLKPNCSQQTQHSSVAYPGWGAFGCSNHSPPEIPKALQKNRAKLNPIVKLLKISEFRTPTPQDVRKKRH